MASDDGVAAVLLRDRSFKETVPGSANGSGSSSTGTPPRLQIASLSANLWGLSNCLSHVIQPARYIQRLAEWSLAGKPQRCVGSPHLCCWLH